MAYFAALKGAPPGKTHTYCVRQIYLAWCQKRVSYPVLGNKTSTIYNVQNGLVLTVPFVSITRPGCRPRSARQSASKLLLRAAQNRHTPVYVFWKTAHNQHKLFIVL